MTSTGPSQTAFATHVFLANGARIFARAWNGPARPLILVLHGWGSRGERWTPVAEALANAGWPVCVPDFPGFGESPPPPRPWAVEDYAAAIDELVKQMGASRTCVLAHSFGARVAIRLAATGRAGIRAMLLTGAAGLRPRITWRRRLVSRFARAGSAVFALPPLRPVGDLARRALYRAIGSMDYYLARGVMRDTFRLVIEEDLADDMRAVRVPVKLLWGAEDRATPLADGRRMAGLIAGAELEIVEGVGHALPHERPELIASRALALFESVLGDHG
jgi:pimeloyl-ACP methyl ester carboxylesterase